MEIEIYKRGGRNMVNIGQLIEEVDVKSLIGIIIIGAGIAMQFIQGSIPEYYIAIMGATVAYYFN